MMSEKRLLMEIRSHPRTDQPLCWECSKKYKDRKQKLGGVCRQQVRMTKEEAQYHQRRCSECGAVAKPHIIEGD